MIQDAGRVGATTIVDTVTAVFSAPEFNPARGFWWWTEYLDFPFEAKTVRWTLFVVVVLLAMIAIARYAQNLYFERRYGEIGGVAGRGGGTRDPWTTAQELAGRGEFTLAAHALYLALLDALARREEVRLHPAKTIGDYLRELRARSSTLLPPVRDFARSYELVAYGFRECDAERYQRLHALASSVVRPNA